MTQNFERPLKLSSKKPGATCSYDQGIKCPQFFISNVMNQENVWEELKEFGIDTDDSATLKYTHKKTKETLKNKERDKPSVTDIAQAIFFGKLPKYIYPQTYQITALECKGMGSIPEKKLTPKQEKQGSSIVSANTESIVRYTFIQGRRSSVPKDRRDHGQVRFKAYADLLPYYKAHMDLGLAIDYEVGEKARKLSKGHVEAYNTDKKFKKHFDNKRGKLPTLERTLVVSGNASETVIDESYKFKNSTEADKKDQPIETGQSKRQKKSTLPKHKALEDGINSIPIVSGLQKMFLVLGTIANSKYAKDYVLIDFNYPKLRVEGNAYLDESSKDLYLRREYSIAAAPLIGVQFTVGLLSIAKEFIPGGKALKLIGFGGEGGVITDEIVDERLKTFSRSKGADAFIMGYINLTFGVDFGVALNLVSDHAPPHKMVCEFENSFTFSAKLKARVCAGAKIFIVKGVLDASLKIATDGITLSIQWTKGYLEYVVHHEGIYVAAEITGSFKIDGAKEKKKKPDLEWNGGPWPIVKKLAKRNSTIRGVIF